MGIAISIGQTGLVASSKQLDVIGNNLANANTVGFKTSSTLFASMMNQGLSSSDSLASGQGVAVDSLSTQFSQGPFENTSNVTDMAIDGEGFFIVHDITGAPFYTRAGAFHIDNNNNLVDVRGFKVQGYALGSNVPTSILLQKAIDATTTTAVSFGANLNESTPEDGTFNVSQTVFDSKGGGHTLSLVFTKTAGNGEWNVQGTLDSIGGVTLSATTIEFDSNGRLLSPAVDATITVNDPDTVALTVGEITAGQTVIMGGVTLTATSGAVPAAGQFYIGGNAAMDAANLVAAIGASTLVTTDGWTATANGTTVVIAHEGAVLAPTDITGTAITDIADTTVTVALIDILKGATIGNAGELNWNLTTDETRRLTGYASESAVRSLYADGFGAGELSSLNVDSKGIISGVYTNGQTLELTRIALANFLDQSALKKSGNYFLESTASGKPTSNRAGTGGMGDIQGNALEISNTDVSKEFINMITAQRAYQASSRIITTADQMLTELMNIKR